MQPAQRLRQVALRHDVVGHRIEDLVGVEVGDLLAAVPARVACLPGEGDLGGATRGGGGCRGRAGARPQVGGVREKAVIGGGLGSSVVGDAPGDPLLVEAAGEVEALEQELDGGGHDRRLLGAVGDVEGAEAVHGLAQPGDLAHPRDVLLRGRALAGLDDEPVLEGLDDRLQRVELDLARERGVQRLRDEPLDDALLRRVVADRSRARSCRRSRRRRPRGRRRAARPSGSPSRTARFSAAASRTSRFATDDADADARALADLRASVGPAGSARRRSPP